MTVPTPRQEEFLAFIQIYWKVHGYSPAVRDISCGMRVAINAVTANLKALERKGAILRDARIARSIRVVDHCTAVQSCEVAELR
jgi:SOS-response transcriptional repressor LexA